MSEDGLSEPCDEPSMELFVESLTGTSFEMRVYSTDTVLDIKNKIFRVEGIPVPQQNLLFQMKELNDHSRLSDLGIVNGSTLRLVTAMRGGPISTRRWTSDHMVWKDLKDLIEHTREELGDKLGTKVSVLVFKEGDVIKWLRVIENEDGSYSPYTEQRAIAPPCTSSGGSGGGGGGCGVSNGGGSIGSRSGNKHYQHHKTATATDGATMSSNTIDFQELMQFKQHASALSSYYHQQQHHHHHNNNNQSQHQHASDAGYSAVLSGVGDHHHHQQQQQQRQQVYRRLEDDVRMKGRVNMLKARMQRAKRNKGKLIVAPSVGGEITGDLTVAEEIAIGRRNDNLVLTAVLNDDLIDDNEEGLDEAFKPDLRLEALLRTLQNSDTLGTTTSERYTLASKYHRRTQSRNNHVLQLDTSQLPGDDLTLFKPIPTGHGSSKHTTGSSSTYLMGTSAATNTTAPTLSTNSSHSGLNLLLMDCPAATAATTSSSSSSSDSGSTSSNSSCSANDLEVALKEKHRSSRLRLHATAVSVVKNAGTASDASDSGDVDAIAKCMKTSVIGRRLSNNSIDLASSLNQPTITLSQQSATSANNGNYVCTNLHVFEPQHDILAPTLIHDSNSPKRKQGNKANLGSNAMIPTTIGSMAHSAAGDSTNNATRERFSLPETKRRAKIGRLLNTTTTPGSGETSDSDDGLWSCQTTANGANRLRHYRPTTKRLVLPDTASFDKSKCGPNADPSSPLDGDQLHQHVILPDIWEHHCSPTSTTTVTSRGGGGGGGGLLCARTTTNTSPNTTGDAASAAASATAAAAMVDATIDIVEDSTGAAAAACLRDYIDLDNEFDKMFSELRSAVPIPSAIPPQYAPKDCQLYLGSPVVPRTAATPSPPSEANKSAAALAGSATAAAHRLSSLGSSLPYHHVGLCASPTTAGTTTRRSPLYHRRTTGTIHMGGIGGQSVGATTDNDRTSIAAAARNMLEKVQRTTASEMGNVAGTVGDKTIRQRRRRYSTDDCEFTLERLQNDYVPDRFDYSDFESYAADVDDMIGCYGQEAVVNARWMEAAAAAASASGSRSGGTSPPGQRHHNSMRLRTTPLHRESTTTTSDHLCIAEQIQRLGLGLDSDAEYKSEAQSQIGGATITTTSLGNTVGSRLGTTVGRMISDDSNNTNNTREFAHSKFMSTGLVPSGGNAGHNTKLPMLVEQRKHQPEHSAKNASAVPATVPAGAADTVPAARTTAAPRMRCARCNRKLNITNIYDCRCGRIFCAQHRYSEVHDCAHDYKTEGRRLLSQQNPLVTAPKLAKF